MKFISNYQIYEENMHVTRLIIDFSIPFNVVFLIFPLCMAKADLGTWIVLDYLNMANYTNFIFKWRVNMWIIGNIGNNKIVYSRSSKSLCFTVSHFHHLRWCPKWKLAHKETQKRTNKVTGSLCNLPQSHK